MKTISYKKIIATLTMTLSGLLLSLVSLVVFETIGKTTSMAPEALADVPGGGGATGVPEGECDCGGCEGC